MKNLVFEASKGKDKVKNVFDHNIQAFSDAADFDWTLESLNAQCDQGWELYSAIYEGEIVSAMFIKPQDQVLLTKNTGIKLTHQGNGFSHMIKDFFEQEASKRNMNALIHLCRDDDFRSIALNESHGYKKVGKLESQGKELIEWKKDLKK